MIRSCRLNECEVGRLTDLQKNVAEETKSLIEDRKRNSIRDINYSLTFTFDGTLNPSYKSFTQAKSGSNSPNKRLLMKMQKTPPMQMQGDSPI